MQPRYVYAVVHALEPRPGETLAEAWSRANAAGSTDQGEPVFATGVLDCTTLIPGATFDVEVIADFDGRASSTVLPVRDEETIPYAL